MTDSSRLAVHGGAPVRDESKRPWPKWPVFAERERAALLEVLDSGNWWFGERVRRFEQGYAAFQGAAQCISCTSGTTALEIVLQALGVQPGDEVITTPYTFVATASAIIRLKAIPVFVDVDASWCLNPELIEAAMTPRTKGIIPVHFGGRICDMDRVNAIAGKHGLFVLEDACHAWGGRWQGRGAGVLGKCGVFSFQHSKNITAGEGGAIVTDDEDFALLCRSLVNCGRDPVKGWYLHVNFGTNARLTEFAAAILEAQLERMDEQTNQRERNAAILNAALAGLEGLEPQPNDPRITRRPYHLYCLRIQPERFGCSRERFIEAARAEGLPIAAGYPMPLYKQPAFESAPFRDYSTCRCPQAEDLCDRSGMWLRHALLLGSEENMQDIIEIARKIKKYARELRE